MISLPRSPVIDRLCTGCIGTRWIQYSRSHGGATKHISSWKIEVNGKCKRKNKKKFCPCVFCLFFPPFFLVTVRRQKGDDESRRNVRKYALISASVFSPRSFFVSSCSLLTQALERTLSTQPGARWKNTQPSWREPNNRGRCPGALFSSPRGVSRAIL